MCCEIFELHQQEELSWSKKNGYQGRGGGRIFSPSISMLGQLSHLILFMLNNVFRERLFFSTHEHRSDYQSTY